MYNSLLHGRHVTGVKKSDHDVNASSTEEQVYDIPTLDGKQSPSLQTFTHSQQLKLLCTRGQVLAHHAGELRKEISKLKTNRLFNVPESFPDEESISLRRNLLEKHAEYNSLIGELKGVKKKIEEVQNKIRLHGPDSIDASNTINATHSNCPN